MFAAEKVDLGSEPVDELTEVERRIEELNTEAEQLGQSMEALGAALRLDACKIQFRGDLIVSDGHTRPSSFVPPIVDLARIRNVICTLKALHAERKHLRVQRQLCASQFHSAPTLTSTKKSTKEFARIRVGSDRRQGRSGIVNRSSAV